jgi:hypothetical protein
VDKLWDNSTITGAGTDKQLAYGLSVLAYAVEEQSFWLRSDTFPTDGQELL